MGKICGWVVFTVIVSFLSILATDSMGADTGRETIKSGGKALSAESAQETSKKLKIVVIGASYARGWTEIPSGKITFINKGMSGEQSFEMLARFKKDVIDERPNFVIIWGYINDIFGSSREVTDRTLERTRNNIIEMVDLARSNGIKPVLATEVTIKGKDGIIETIVSWIGRIKGTESYQDYVNRYVLRTNQWIREYALEQRIPILDFQPLLSDGKGRRKKEYATVDGSHLSAAAYSRLSEYTSEKLNLGVR